jgi:hypothetical protein
MIEERDVLNQATQDHSRNQIKTTPTMLRVIKKQMTDDKRTL